MAITLATLAALYGGTKLAQGAIKGVSSGIQRRGGEQIAEDALRKLRGLEYEAGPQYAVTQESRDLAELQKKQAAEAVQQLREQNLALAQQAIASGVQDPTRSGQAISAIAPQLSQQLGQAELSAAQQMTAADAGLARLAESYGQSNVQRAQQIADMNIQAQRGLEGQLRAEGQQAASLGFAGKVEGLSTMANAPAAYTQAYLAGAPYAGKDGILKADEGGSLDSQIYKTGGEFNHDTNKKALIDEETGEKEAELTGEEVVLNPEQTDNTMQAAEILFKFLESNPEAPEEIQKVANLLEFLNEPQFQVGQQEIDIQ